MLYHAARPYNFIVELLSKDLRWWELLGLAGAAAGLCIALWEVALFAPIVFLPLAAGIALELTRPRSRRDVAPSSLRHNLTTLFALPFFAVAMFLLVRHIFSMPEWPVFLILMGCVTGTAILWRRRETSQHNPVAA